MTNQEKLVKFMEYKQDLLTKIVGENNYFCENDKEFLLDLSDEHSKSIIKSLIDSIIDHKLTNLLIYLNCPFCIFIWKILKKTCYLCEYALNHGECTNKNSDFMKIKKMYDIEIDKNFIEIDIEKFKEIIGVTND